MRRWERMGPCGNGQCTRRANAGMALRPHEPVQGAPFGSTMGACALDAWPFHAHVVLNMIAPQTQSKDTLPEWSKGVDSSSTSASCVGSNPTGVIILPVRIYYICWQHVHQAALLAARARYL